jgi:hypothetical protein
MEMAMESMETAVESIEMAPGAISRPDRVPDQRLMSPEIHLRWWWRFRTLLGETLIFLGFLRRRLNIGRGAMSEGTRGSHTTGWRAQGAPMPPGGVATPGPPPTLLWTPSYVGENRNFGLHFVQFREYFLCNFFKTQKYHKIGNWHCGISSIG